MESRGWREGKGSDGGTAVSTRFLCTLRRKANVIFKGWRRLVVYIGVVIGG